MLQCRRFYTDENFKNRIITHSYNLRNLKWSTKNDEPEKKNNLDISKRNNININNMKVLKTSNSTNKNIVNKEEDEEKIMEILKQKKEISFRARKRIISRLKNSKELTEELEKINKEEKNKETDSVNKYNKYKRINSNNNIEFENDSQNIYKRNKIYLKSTTNNSINTDTGYRNRNIEIYNTKNNNIERSLNTNADNGKPKPNLLLYRNVRHIYKKNVIKTLVLKDKNSIGINYSETNAIVNNNINNNNYIISKKRRTFTNKDINKQNEESKFPVQKIKIINGNDNSINNNLNLRNKTETNLNEKCNSYIKKFTRINSDFIENKIKKIKDKQNETNNIISNNNHYNNNNNGNENIKLKRIKTIKNNEIGKNRFSYYHYLITKEKRKNGLDNENNNKYSNMSFKLESNTHKTYVRNRFNNNSNMINLKALPNNKKFKSIETEKIDIIGKAILDKKSFAITFFEYTINICDSINNRNLFINLIHNFNLKYFFMNNSNYNDEYSTIFNDNENFEYVIKHFGLVLICLIFLSKDDILYNTYNNKVKELLIQIIYSSLNYMEMDNCIESDIIYNFNKDNNFQLNVSIHRYVFSLINLLFDNRKEYLSLKEALVQLHSILMKKDYYYILKIINESILFCHNSKQRSTYTFPFFKFNNHIISLKIPKDNSNYSNYNTKTNSNSNSIDKEKVESIPFIKSPMKKKFCLVLDIDETISHTLKLSYGGYFLLRPGAKSFLEEVCKYYEIIIFTSSPKKYADKILDIIDVNGNIFSHRLYKNHVLYENGKTVKNLNLIGRDLLKTIFIDNLRSNAKYNLDNLCPITTWKSDIFDTRLIKLKDKLCYIATCGKYDDDITQGL